MKKKISRSLGFTLIEILIVLAIMGFVAVVGMKNFNRSENIKTTLRRFAAVIKKARTYAKLNHQTYRLVIQVEENKSQFWVEGSSKPVFLDPNAERVSSKKSEKDTKDEKSEGASDGFSPAPEILKNPHSLPNDWAFSEIESEGQKQGNIEGTHYVYFLPQGIAEEAVIQVSNTKSKGIWTIYIPPHSTQIKIFTEAKKLKDMHP